MLVTKGTLLDILSHCWMLSIQSYFSFSWLTTYVVISYKAKSTSSEISSVWFKSNEEDWPTYILFPCKYKEIISIKWIFIRAFPIRNKTCRVLQNVRWLSRQHTCNYPRADMKSYLNTFVARKECWIEVLSSNTMQD